MAERPPNVVIIGAGLAGMTLALCLTKQHGITPSIYELRGEDDNRGANIALAPNGLRTLQHVGVYDKIRTKGFNFENIYTYNAQGQSLGSFLMGSEKHYNFAALRIHRSLVHEALLNEVKAQGIPIHNNMKLAAVEEETNSGVRLRFESGQVVEADFAIGADGIHSKVRQHITEVDLQYSGFMGIIGLTFPKDNLRESHKNIAFPSFTFGKSGFVAMLPSNYAGSVVDFFSTFPFPAQTKEFWDDLAVQRDKQQKMLVERFGGDDWPEHISEVVNGHPSENLNCNAFFEVPPLDHWYSPTGRIIILGDSAHAMSPQAGIGASIAFEDAESLAYTMAHTNFITDRLTLLSRWETHRQERVKRVKAMADANGRKRKPESNSVSQAIKEIIIWSQAMWNGPLGGMEWVYGYNVEDTLGYLSG